MNYLPTGIINIFGPTTIIFGQPIIYPPNDMPQTSSDHTPPSAPNSSVPLTSSSNASTSSVLAAKKEENKKTEVNHVKRKICKNPEDEKARKIQSNKEHKKRQQLKKLHDELKCADSRQKFILEQKIVAVNSELNQLKDNRRNKIWKNPASETDKVSDNNSFKVVDEYDEKYNEYLKIQFSMLPYPEIKKTASGQTLACFYSRHYFLSNFYPSEFSYKGKSFSTSEQFYQFYKAIAAEKFDLATEILDMEDPLLIKRITKDLKMPPEWENKKLNVMEVALLLKFEQNLHLKKMLMSTEKALFVECNPYDDFWGIKKKITDPNVTNFSTWPKNSNKLGVMLTELRNKM